MICMTTGRLTDLDVESPPRQPYDAYTPPVGAFIAPHRCPHCENVPTDVFPLPPYSVIDPDPLPCYDDLFPPGYIPFSSPKTHLFPSFNTLPNTLPPTPSFPLDQPPSYDSLFTTAAPSDSAEALQISQIIGIACIHMLGLVVHPHTLFLIPLLEPSSNLIKKERIYTQWIWRGSHSSKVLQPGTACEYMFHYFDFW